MTFAKATRIEALRTGPVMHSARRIAEIIEDEFPEKPDLRGNQLHGQDLMKEALEFLYGKPFLELTDEVLEAWGL